MRKLALLLALAMLAGCAQIPTQLDVRTGPEIATQSDQEFAYYTPSGPAQDASQQEIVSGFLAAGTGPQNDYSVARSFLTSDFSQRWNPDAAVLIRSGAPQFRESGTGLQVVTLSINARLDEHGRYQEPGSTDSVSLRFQLVREGGQWRIASAPNLTVVTPPVFAVVFKPYSVYFLDSQQKRLVADSRWFPSRASTGTRLVNALLDGPSSWMAPAIQTAIPAGTKLTIDAVRVEDGVAQVDFDTTALSADAIGRRLMLTQLRATLLQLSGVNEVAIYVNSSPQDIAPTSIQPLRNGSVGIALAEGVFRLVGGQEALPGTAVFADRFEPTMIATNALTNQIVFATPTGVYLLSGSGVSTRTELLTEQTEIAALAFDPDGLIWVVPRSSGSAIEIYDRLELVQSLVLPALGNRLEAELSSDGARMAVLLDGQDRPRVEVFTVSRDVRSRPSLLSRGITISTTQGVPLSFTWQSQVALRVLESSITGQTTLSEYPLAGQRVQLSTPPIVGVKLISGPSSFTIYLLSESAEVWTLSGGSWRRVASGVVDITSAR